MVILATNWSSRISVRICGPSNTPALISNYNPGGAVMMCWKHSPSVSTALTNCFIKPNLMWRGGKMILYLFPIVSCMIFGMPASRVSRIGQSFWTQCLSRTRLSHIQRKHGNLLKPFCYPRRKLTIFNSTQMIQLCAWYFNNDHSHIIIVFLQMHWVTDRYCFINIALCKITHFRLCFELSKNSPHSAEQ